MIWRLVNDIGVSPHKCFRGKIAEIGQMTLLIRAHNGRKALLALIQKVKGIIEHKVVAAAESKRIHVEGRTDTLIELSRPFSKFGKLSQIIRAVRKLTDYPARLLKYIDVGCEIRWRLRSIHTLSINIEAVTQSASYAGCVLQHDVLMPVIIDIELRCVGTPTKVVEHERPIDGSEFFVLIVFQFTKVLHILIKEIQHVLTHGCGLPHDQGVRLSQSKRRHKKRQGHTVDDAAFESPHM